MFLRCRELTKGFRGHAGEWAMLAGAALLLWATGAVAEIVMLAGTEPVYVVNTDNMGTSSASKAAPNDVVGDKGSSVTFNVYYDDVDNGTGVGFDDVNYGQQRRACVTEVLSYISSVLQVPGRTCDIEFNRSATDGTGQFYTGNTWFSSVAGFTNGFAFEHIVNNRDMSTELKDMFITMDFGWSWFSGDGAPSTSQYDLRSALLQVLSQGLGLFTLGKSDGSSASGTSMTYSVWDSMLATATGTVLWSGTPPAFHATAADLRGATGGIFFQGAKAVEFNEGEPAVYTPSVFNSYKSLGYWNKTSDVVMKPALATGETQREYSLLDLAALYDIGYTNVVLPFTFTLTPRGGWFSVGDRVELSVRAVGATGNVSYQWQKDGNNYPGATSATFAIDPVALLHTGNYACVATDDNGGHVSPSVNVRVFTAGELPAMGIVGLCLVAAACVLAGALIILRR